MRTRCRSRGIAQRNLGTPQRARISRWRRRPASEHRPPALHTAQPHPPHVPGRLRSSPVCSIRGNTLSGTHEFWGRGVGVGHGGKIHPDRDCVGRVYHNPGQDPAEPCRSKRHRPRQRLLRRRLLLHNSILHHVGHQSTSTSRPFVPCR